MQVMKNFVKRYKYQNFCGSYSSGKEPQSGENTKLFLQLSWSRSTFINFAESLVIFSHSKVVVRNNSFKHGGVSDSKCTTAIPYIGIYV